MVPLSETNVSGKFGFNVHDTCSTTSSSGSIHITPTDPMLAMAQALRVASKSIANMSAGQNANSVEPSSTAPFSDAIASQITLSPTKQSYPYYLRNETLAGIPYDVYHHIDTSFDCTITRSDLEGKLFVAQRDGSLVSVNFVEGFRPGTWFKEMVSEYIPDHIVMRAHEAKCYPLPGNRSSLARGGTPISHPFYVMFNGWCSGANKRNKNHSNLPAKCSTSYVSGLTLEDLEKFATSSDGSASITLTVQINGQCFHRRGRPLGQLSGTKRREHVEQMSNMRRLLNFIVLTKAFQFKLNCNFR